MRQAIHLAARGAADCLTKQHHKYYQRIVLLHECLLLVGQNMSIKLNPENNKTFLNGRQEGCSQHVSLPSCKYLTLKHCQLPTKSHLISYHPVVAGIGVAMVLTTEESWFDFQQRQDIFLVSKTSRTPRVPIQPPRQ
jgi:hypothetical protein